MKTRILINILVLTLTACNFMNENANPKYFFEGDYLPLGKAIYESDAKKLSELLEKKRVPLDSIRKGGDTDRPTLLMYAVILQKQDMVEILLKHGANPEQFCLMRHRMKVTNPYTGEEILYYEANPLDWATSRIDNISKAKKIVGLLIDYGADVNGFGIYYDSPLRNALMSHEGLELFDFLLEKGADINAYADKMGSTALIIEASGNCSRFIPLLERGADPQIINFAGWDVMRRIEYALPTCPKEKIPFLEDLKNRLIREYGMIYPPVQDKERGKAIRDAVYEAKGWAGKVI
ncbi:MAG: hypothetical protein LBT25_02750 [Candidatus Symbiothrix sp.]|nr:hypothetical protein [Candidatus Symbiothrix sp.]